jgi:large subunit ribosomal protein L33
MAKEHRVLIKLKSSKSPHVYWTTKNKNNTTGRLELSKYDPVVREVAVYRETK